MTEHRQPLPSTGIDDSPDTVAHHEAGHAVLHVLLCPWLPLERVAVGPARAGLDGAPRAYAKVGQPLVGYSTHPAVTFGQLTPAQLFAYAVTGHGGWAAELERRQERYPAEPEYRRKRWGDRMMATAWGGDVDVAGLVLGRGRMAHHVERAQTMYAAARMVPAVWPAVGAVAAALLAEGTLTGARVLELAQAAMGDQWPTEADVAAWLATDDDQAVAP